MGKKTGTVKKTDTPLYSRDGPVVSYKPTASHSTGLRQVTHPPPPDSLARSCASPSPCGGCLYCVDKGVREVACVHEGESLSAIPVSTNQLGHLEQRL